MAAAVDNIQENPLIKSENLDFPLFDQVKAEHVVTDDNPAHCPVSTKWLSWLYSLQPMEFLLKDTEEKLKKLEEGAKPTWESLVVPYERLVDGLEKVWNVVSHLKGVKDNDALRKAYDEIQPKKLDLMLKISQSQKLYNEFQALRDSKEYTSLDSAQQRIVENELRDFRLGGVALQGEQKDKFNEIKKELSALSTKFSNNLLDATKAFKKIVTDKAVVEGLPPSALGLASQRAKEEGHKDSTPENGPWLLTLDFPSYFPVQTNAKNRDLRKELYIANITRASSGDIDNSQIIQKILQLKLETAKLLGFKNYAEQSMATKMATPDQADKLLEDLRKASYEAAKKDLNETIEFAKEQGYNGKFELWDNSYWAERYKEAKFDFKEEELRPYFALPNVLDGLFGTAERLFGVKIEAADGQAPVWDPAVRFFKVLQNGQTKAYFYLDPYSRPAEKRGGAWMDEVQGQTRNHVNQEKIPLRLPVAHMVCNQSPPIGDEPSLMTFREVETLFHEFGHAQQHMYTQQKEGLVAGIRNVEWDAVELPSQFMENWCYDRKTLYSFAKHFKTGEPLPEEYYQKLLKSKTFRSGTFTLRQLHFAITDLELHSRYDPYSSETPFDREKKVAEKTTVIQPLPEDRFLNGFSHIFAGGYAAGYYSYKWAEVLSADAFGAFEEVGLENESKIQEVGQKFRDTVLALGGGQSAAKVFNSFRGRDPNVEALLRHNDLLPASA